MKRFEVFLLAALLSVGSVFSEEKITVGYLSFPPYEYEENSAAAGVTVEIVREVFRRMDQPAAFRLLPFPRILIMLKTGQLDAAFELLKTPERMLYLDYGQTVLMEESVSLFALKGSGLSYDGSLYSFRKSRIGILRDFSYGEAFDQAVSEGILENTVRTGDAVMVVKMLLNRRVELIAGDTLGIRLILREMGRLEEVEDLGVLESTPTYMVFSKQSDMAFLFERFDRVLSEMKEDGSYQDMIDTFFSLTDSERGKNN